MGDQDQGAGESLKLFAQKRQPFSVQVRGWLIRQQQLRAGREGGRDPVSGHFTSGQPVTQPLGPEQRAHLIIRLFFTDSLLADESHGPRTADHALVRFLLAGKQAQQGGLPGTVFTDEADPVPVVHGQAVHVDQLFDTV